ncbi:MAG: sulfotransferase [Magnetococcales bacterium]|nr:sulfotransferase [Magnetococcales bacterium]
MQPQQKQLMLQEIISHLNNNRLKEARTLCISLLKEQPDAHEVWQILATIATRQENHREAAKHLDQAIQINPNIPQYFNHLGKTFRAIGAPERAAASYRKALQLDPAYGMAYLNLGQLALDLRAFRDAATTLEEAVRLKPNNPRARLLLATALQHLGEADKVATLCDALVASSQDAATLSQVANLLVSANRQEKALEALQKARIESPDDPWLTIMEARIANVQSDRPKAIALLEGIPAAHMDLPQQRLTHGELGRLYDREGESRKAYDHFQQQGHIGKRIAQQLGIVENKAMIRAQIMRREANAEWRDSWLPHPDPKIEKPPIFLVGFPRSGTTLLGQILNAHPELEVVDERIGMETISTQFDKQDGSYLKALARATPAEVHQLREIYEGFMWQEQAGEISSGRRLVDKNPPNILYMPTIMRLYPNARFILALRHPCDAILSSYMQTFDLGVSLAQLYTLEENAQYYRTLMGLWRHFAHLFSVSFQTIRYEALIEDLEGEMRKLLEGLDMGWSPELLNYREKIAQSAGAVRTPSAQAVHQPLYGHAAQRWKRYADQMEPLLPGLERDLKAFGYEV